MPIKKFVGQYRPQRQGKIHLGVKKFKTGEGGKVVEYPAEVNYFVMKDCPELVEVYGRDPEDILNPGDLHRELHVTLLSARFEEEKFDDYLEKVFPQYYKRYRMSGLFCKGDGETADCINVETGAMDEIECPCEYLEKGDCKQIGIFRFRVQEVVSLNIYQITTSSTNSILNINSFLRDILEFCIVNRIDPSSVKLVLKREMAVVQRMDNGHPTHSKHFLLVLDLDKRFYKNLDEVATKALPMRLSRAKGPGALPPPLEDKDDLIYLTEEAKQAVEEEQAAASKELEEETKRKDEERQIEQVKSTLNDKLEEFKKLGGKLSRETIDKICAFKKFEEYSAELTRIDEAIEKRKKLKPAEKKLDEKKSPDASGTTEKKDESAGGQGEIPF